VIKEAATINNPAKSSKKCFQCGLKNFAARDKCSRCKASLSKPVAVAKKATTVGEEVESNRSKFSFALVLSLLVVAFAGLLFFYMRPGPQGRSEVAEAALTSADKPDTRGPREIAEEQDSQSEAAGTEILIHLKRFQNGTESGMDYDEYIRKLNSLKTELNDALSSFVRHKPNDETFRREVEGVIQDNTAAAQWWKTTITNNGVFTEADRNERTQRNWASARAHLTNAEKMLNP
jgi:hypothetical protein